MSTIAVFIDLSTKKKKKLSRQARFKIKYMKTR